LICLIISGDEHTSYTRLINITLKSPVPTSKKTLYYKDGLVNAVYSKVDATPINAP
jgi:hypothetical protein